MREKDDYGYDLTWLTPKAINNESSVAEARERLNIYAHRDAQLAETGITDGMFNNLPYPVSLIGGFLKDIDDYANEFSDDSTLTLRTFLEVGCGSAVKATMAADLFYYMSSAIDISEEHVENSRKTVSAFNQERHVKVEQADALTYNQYASADVTFLNRLFLGPETQVNLERKVWDDMRTGSFLILVNGLSSWPGSLIVANNKCGAVYRKTTQ